MNSKTDTAGGTLDTAKLVVAVLIAVSALTAFYIFAEQSLLYRVLGLLAAAGVAAAVALQTQKGRYLLEFIQDAQIETRKVVWPSRQETIHTTLIVLAVVVIVSFILWLLDMFLGWSIGLLIG
jgi:preprotein translocase subunit SecE